MNGEPPLPRHYKGKRPQFFEDPAVDTLLKIVLELVQEHWVTRERLLTLEAFLAAEGRLDESALAAFTVDRAADRDAYVERIFAVLGRPADL